MTDWHGYPQHPEAHPERPWWRRIHDGSGYWWERQTTAHRRTLLPDVDWPDALEEDEAIAWYDAEVARRLAEHDAAHPLPPPEPRCGQVWVWPELLRATDGQPAARMVTGLLLVDQRVLLAGEPLPVAEWPPPDAVLVAGPGAPWAPMGER